MPLRVFSASSGPDGWVVLSQTADGAPQKPGHLLDLEALYSRARDTLLPQGATADLTNRATEEANHDRWSLPELVDRFETARRALVIALRGAAHADLERAACLPRLGTPMRLIDLAFFVAEHDDHHMARLRTLLEGGEVRE